MTKLKFMLLFILVSSAMHGGESSGGGLGSQVNLQNVLSLTSENYTFIQVSSTSKALVLVTPETVEVYDAGSFSTLSTANGSEVLRFENSRTALEVVKVDSVSEVTEGWITETNDATVIEVETSEF